VALCRHFLGAGARIAALDVKPTVAALGTDLDAPAGSFAHVVADIGDPAAVASAFATLSAALGPIDVLVNNAGGSDHPAFALTDPAGWRQEFARNLDSAYYCAHAVLPGMKQRGHGVIIAVGSVNGLAALGDPAYSAAKAGMISLSRSLAQEYGRFGIRSNIVLPGTVRTPLWQKRAAKDPKVLETLRRWYPLGRIVEPEDVANAVAFLASDAAAAITGVALPVDCGLMSGNIVMTRELTLEDF